ERPRRRAAAASDPSSSAASAISIASSRSMLSDPAIEPAIQRAFRRGTQGTTSPASGAGRALQAQEVP
ncbi:hypothetical protein HMPREF0731_3712, partial [Pseudoroseomonas cervicalis ATCC 49957]